MRYLSVRSRPYQCAKCPYWHLATSKAVKRAKRKLETDPLGEADCEMPDLRRKSA